MQKGIRMIPQHILVPIDFSEFSKQALGYAIDLATKLQARLTLLHVIQPLPSGVDIGVILPAGYMEELEAGLHQSLQSYYERVTQAGLQGEILVEHGIPFKIITDVAATHHVDMIVMGTQGRTGLQHLLIGSVAEKVVRLAPCAVLVVRQATVDAAC